MPAHGHPLVAAIRPVDTNAATTVGRVGRRDNIRRAADSHTELWRFYSDIPEVHFWVNTMSGITRMVHFYPGLQPDDTGVTDPEPDEDAAVLELWREIGGEQKIRALTAELVAHRRVTGEAYLVPLDDRGALIRPFPSDDPLLPGDIDPTEADAETHWDVVSAIELKRLANLDASGAILDPGLPVWRVWKRHPADAERADPPLAAVRRQCLALLALDGRVLADARSRLSAGVHLFPSSLRNVPTANGKTFDKMLDDVLLTPIRDETSVDAVVPAIAYIEPDEINAHKAITFGRSDIAADIAQREELVRRIAAGLDAPAELLLGMGDLNHWSAWLITDTTYTQHADPDIVGVLNDLSVWWRNLLAASGINPQGRLLWRDPNPALRRSDPLADTIAAYDRFEASGEALRKAAGLDDSDIPTADEIERRLRIAQLSRGASVSITDDAGVDTMPDSANPADGDTPPPPAASQRPRIVLLAAGHDHADLTDLAADLAQLDRELLAETIAFAETEIGRVADAAIARLDDAITADPRYSTIGVTWDTLDPAEIANLVGPDAGITADDFDPGPFTDLIAGAEQLRRQTLQDAGIDVAEVDTDADTSLAVAGILAALAATAIAAVLRSGASTDTLGENDPSPRAAPVRDLRESLTAAGGATTAAALDIDLIANGARTIDDLARAGLVTVAYQWVYGDIPRQTFRPHRRMDGVEFESFDDDALIPPAGASWLGPFMYPGDHKGCRCTYRRVLAIADEAA